jgi:hypothetical protein
MRIDVDGGWLENDLLCHAAALSTNMLHALMSRGIVLNEVRDYATGMTPLHLAATRNHNPAVMQTLVEVCGIDVDVCDSNGDTPLHSAARHMSFDGLRWLIAAGADIDAQNIGGQTPLHFVCRSEESVVLLLMAGANVHTRNGDGLTPCTKFVFRFISHPSQMTIVNLFAAAGADLDDVADGASVREAVPNHLRSLFDIAADIEAQRRRIAKLRLDHVRNRALQVCIGLHPLPLGLDALQMCEILQHSCGRFAPLIPFHRLQPK